jgi:hypothetical protein
LFSEEACEMKDLFELELGTMISPSDPYIAAYPHLLEFFRSKTVFSRGDVICGAHMVYGWMPTILEIYAGHDGDDLDEAARLLTRAKAGERLNAGDIGVLARVVNNSVVGASKLLHFVAPHTYAIWDSRVYTFVHQKRPHQYRVNSVAMYLNYLAHLLEQLARDGFGAFHASVNAKVGYPVSPLRSLELVMFLNSSASET